MKIITIHNSVLIHDVKKGSFNMENTFELVKSEKFYGVPCDFYKGNDDEMWLTRKQIGEALEYKDPKKSIEKIHSRYQDRLDRFSTVVKLTTLDGKNRDNYIYSERGVMEICRWSRQPKADEFMDWVWDIVQAYRHGTLQPVENNTSLIMTEEFLNKQNELLEQMENENKVFRMTMVEGFANMSKLVESILQLNTKSIGKNDNKLEDRNSSDKSTWDIKKEIYKKIDDFLESIDYDLRSKDVLAAIYEYMRNNYGIVWEQEVLDYRAENELERWVSTIEVVVNNSNLLDIFMSILDTPESLKDACEKYGGFSISIEVVKKWKMLQEKILNYARRIGNNSTNAMVLYRKLYKNMNVDWSEYPEKSLKRKLIKSNKELLDEFERVVNELTEQ